METDVEKNILKHDILTLLYDREISESHTNDFLRIAYTENEIFKSLNLTDSKQLYITLEDLIQTLRK